MYYRRKVILALLQIFGGSLGKTKFQKLLLLYTKTQTKPDYHFVPYKYGCYSFQAVADLSTMYNFGQIRISNTGIDKTDNTDYINQLKQNDQKALAQLYLLQRNRTYKDLIRDTYTQFPYYAINSAIASRYLNNEELRMIEACKPYCTKTALYTIGYEGISLEEYLNKLLVKGVKALIDVRNNPQSMKYGFTKAQLIKACLSVGIDYVHFPQVGIVSEARQNLKNQSDYDKLFEKYRNETLSRTVSVQEKILSLLKDKKRIALTCFEANICQCHRKHLAEAITKLSGWKYELIHM